MSLKGPKKCMSTWQITGVSNMSHRQDLYDFYSPKEPI